MTLTSDVTVHIFVWNINISLGEGCGVLKSVRLLNMFFFLFKGNQGRFSPLIPKVNVKVVCK